jgi:ATP-dependent Clp protease ATP-binding subunit ClpA
LCVDPELHEQLGIETQADSIRKQAECWHTPSTPIPTSKDLPVTADLGRVFERASLSADARQCREIRTEHLLFSMLEEPGHVTELLVDSGVTKEKLLVLMAAVDCNAMQVETDAARAAMRSIFEGE